MMETYPWWNEKHKKLADDVRKFADENIPRGEEILWTREFPSDLLKKVAEKGWFKASIPKEYGGTDIGATGCCIITEELSRVCFALAGAYVTTIIGGTEQILKFGNTEQRKRWLPKIAKGELLGAICISEPVVGSDAAGMGTTANLDGDEYVINGKKKFIINAGVADIYCVYAKTSNRMEDKTKYNHLSAFIVKKDMLGFAVEKINELSGWSGLPNGCLDFNDVRVPVENRIGAEGDGWQILVNGLNLERNFFAAGMLGPMREATRYAVSHAKRRIQFGQPVINFQVNQFKIADMISRLQTARLLVYHTAHLLDMKMETVLEAAIAKLFVAEAYKMLVDDAVQVMGGDGWTRFYPVESFLRDAKVNEMAAGTSEVMRTIIYRWGLKAMTKELKIPHRQVHRKLGVPTSTPKPQTITKISEKSILQLLAEDYRVNPSLYMSRDDMKERLKGISDEQLDKLLMSLEAKGLVLLYKDKRDNITLAKATYKGLRHAKPLEYYKWFPKWIKKEIS
jgi:alkylation response protein AidB-like acyl-CoA dehydrogenase